MSCYVIPCYVIAIPIHRSNLTVRIRIKLTGWIAMVYRIPATPPAPAMVATPTLSFCKDSPPLPSPPPPLPPPVPALASACKMTTAPLQAEQPACLCQKEGLNVIGGGGGVIFYGWYCCGLYSCSAQHPKLQCWCHFCLALALTCA